MAKTPLVASALFPRFPTLAGELRNDIWRHALPDKVEPALVSYQPGCWQAHGAEPNLDLVFEHERLQISFELPLLLVNREASSLAQAYIRKLGLTATARRYQDPVFTHKFNPNADALYIKPNQLLDMINDVYLRIAEPDIGSQVFSHWSTISSIAMSEATLRREIDRGGLPELLTWFTSVNEVLVVLNAAPDLECTQDCPSRVQARWSFASAPGDIFYWNRSRERFERRIEDSFVGDRVVAELVENDALAALFAQDLAERNVQVRPVFAISHSW
jgi:hypothetical protein